MKFLKTKKEKKRRGRQARKASKKRPARDDDNPFGNTTPSSNRSRDSSLSLSACYNCCKQRLVKTNAVEKDDAEFDLNISFSGGYVPNTDLIRVDKGQGNPQFKGVHIH